MILLWPQTLTGAAAALLRSHLPSATTEEMRRQNHCRCFWISGSSRLRSNSAIAPHSQWKTKFSLPGKPQPNCQQWLSKGSHFVSLTALPLGVQNMTRPEKFDSNCSYKKKIKTNKCALFDFVSYDKKWFSKMRKRLFVYSEWDFKDVYNKILSYVGFSCVKPKKMIVFLSKGLLARLKKMFWVFFAFHSAGGVPAFLNIILICNHKTADLSQGPRIGPPPPSRHTHSRMTLERAAGKGRCCPANLHKYAERLKY